MPGNFKSPDGDLENLYVTEYDFIDRYVTTGSLWVCGDNLYGQLGTNNTTKYSSPVQIYGGGTNWKQIECGNFHMAAIKTDGTLWLWGRNSGGQLGDNTITSKSSPIQTVSGGTNWKQASAGGAETAAIKTDGTLWIWGDNSSGSLGDNTITSKSSPVQTVSGGNNWKQVSSSGAVGAIKTDGTLWVWGANDWGVLGTNNFTSYSSPVQTIAGGTNWKQVSISGTVGAAIKTDGTLWMLGGWDDYGAMGAGSTMFKRSSPAQTISGGTNWKLVTAQSIGCSAIKTDGTLWLWGIGVYGALGDNTSVSKSSPVQTVAGGNNWKQVFRTLSNWCSATKTDGTLWTWGRDYEGNLGTAEFRPYKSSPVQTIAGGTNWKQASGGGYSAAAIYFYDANNQYPSS